MYDPTNEPLYLIKQKIRDLSSDHSHLLIAIDGRCASGKTTLAAQLRECLGCHVIHMDHFFLQPHMRTKERLDQPGGNVDHERFLEEVLLPLSKKEPFSYQPYNCHKQQFDPAITIPSAPITIIEGSYSCHPSLEKYYHYRIFLSTSYENQLRRIAKRNGENALATFKEKWIPLEEKYFETFHIENICDICLET